MSSIAIVGPDGAGKTTITRRLVRCDLFPFKYLYMGINLEACNFVLPTTRWAEAIKGWLGRKNRGAEMFPPAARSPKGLSKLLAYSRGAARLLNRLADEWYRQLLSWYFQSRGAVVLYDRHFVFDFSTHPPSQGPETFDAAAHRWLLRRFYPLPDLVIFLDAPPETLWARKREWSVENLRQKREALLQIGKECRNFQRVDATQPLENVYSQVVGIIAKFCAENPGMTAKGKTLASSQ